MIVPEVGNIVPLVALNETGMLGAVPAGVTPAEFFVISAVTVELPRVVPKLLP